jgi:hypothetical protein
MSRTILAAWILAAGMACGQPLGQPGESNISFEVASVKPSGPQSVRLSNGGPGTRNPERFTSTRAVLRDLIFRAYTVDDYWAQILGPAWIDKEEYDVAVKIPPGTSDEQFRVMLRNLLAEVSSSWCTVKPKCCPCMS